MGFWISKFREWGGIFFSSVSLVLGMSDMQQFLGGRRELVRKVEVLETVISVWGEIKKPTEFCILWVFFF